MRVWLLTAVASAAVVGSAVAFLATLYLGVWLSDPVAPHARVVDDTSFRPIAAAVLGAPVGSALVLTVRRTRRRRQRPLGGSP